MENDRVSDVERIRPAVVGRSCWLRWTSISTILLFLVAVVATAQDGQTAANPVQSDSGSQAQANSAKPDANKPAKQTKEEKVSAAENLRKRQIADESTQLLVMAVALKAEIDKTNKDMLSLNVIRKADEIEKLAHTVKEKIKQSAGPG